MALGLKLVTYKSGIEKGFTERSVEIIRNAAFACKYTFTSIESANNYLQSMLETINATKDIASEKEALRPLGPRYEVSEIIKNLKVDKLSCVVIHSNKYSVPDSFVGKILLAKVYPDTIQIFKNISLSCHS